MALIPEPSGDLTVEFRRGQSINWAVTLKKTVSGVKVPVDLTLATAIVWQFRRSPEGVDVELELSIANGRIAIDVPATDGALTITSPASTTIAMLADHGTHDMFVTFSTGAVIPYVSGEYRVIPRTTK